MLTHLPLAHSFERFRGPRRRRSTTVATLHLFFAESLVFPAERSAPTTFMPQCGPPSRRACNHANARPDAVDPTRRIVAKQVLKGLDAVVQAGEDGL